MPTYLNSNRQVQSPYGLRRLVTSEFTMESIQRAFFTASFAQKCLTAISRGQLFRTRLKIWCVTRPEFMVPRRNHSSRSRSRSGSGSGSETTVRAGWLLGLGDKKNFLPDIVKAGDPVLHEPAQEVRTEEIKTELIQKIVDDMVTIMRKAPGVGLAAPQIGIPLRIIVLEDTKEYIGYAPKEETKKQDRRPFDLLVVINPKLEKKGNKTALFFEGCLSVDGFRAVVNRHLEVEVTGYDRDGQQIKVNASGWQARIFQHECDHLDGTLYVDRMEARTFRTVENLDLPLANGCPKLGVCSSNLSQID